MAKKTTAQKVADYFKSNIARKEVFATADGFLFEAKQDAKNHAKTLKDKKVETFAKSAKVKTTETAAAEKAAKQAEAKAKAEEAKKQEEAAKEAATNSAGQPKNPATTGADQKTVK